MANLDQATNPSAESPQGSSSLYRFGTSPNTRTAISQKVRLLTPSSNSNGVLNQIGVLGTFSVSMSRQAEPVRGIGFGDKIAELVPGVQDAASINFERALLYLSNIFQATGYKGGVDGNVRSLSHHRWPFDIREEVVFSELASSPTDGGTPVAGSGYDNKVLPGITPETKRDVLITVYEACWITNYSRSITKDQSIIMESGDFMVTDVHAGGTSVNSYNEAFQQGGDRRNSARYTATGNVGN